MKESLLIQQAVAELQQVMGRAEQEPVNLERPVANLEKSEESKGHTGEEMSEFGLKKGANQNRKRNALGRGLSALMTSNSLEVPLRENSARSAVGDSSATKLPEAELPQLAVVASVAGGEGLIEVALSALIANPQQPRQHFDEGEIEDLARSLKQSGVLQPILVRTRSDGQKGYEIIAGERRFRAAQKAGLRSVPVLLRELSDREVLEVSIVENVQRSQLNAIDEARAYARLQSEFSLSQEEIAETVGKDRATIANSLRLLKLPAAVHGLIIEGRLSAGHARALLMLESEDEQARLAQRIVENLLSVRATEQLVRDCKNAPSSDNSVSQSIGDSSPTTESRTSAASIQRQALEERFRRALGTKVQLRLNSRGAGELKISFFSQEELDQLLDTLGA